jgi:hypothetical protein
MSMTNNQPRTLESVRAAVLEHVPVLYRPTYERAFAGNSKAAGIKAMCLSCCGNVRAEVTACQTFACPLHSYRPYQAGTDATEQTGEQEEQQ